MKTFITQIYGRGAPLYLVSAESKKRAWELIKEARSERYGRRNAFNLKTDYNGLAEIRRWHSDIECIEDVHGMYSTEGMLKKGSYKGL